MGRVLTYSQEEELSRIAGTPGRPLASGFPTPNGAVVVASTMEWPAWLARWQPRNGGESDSAAGGAGEMDLPQWPLVQIVSGPLATHDSPGNGPPREGSSTPVMRDGDVGVAYSVFVCLFLKFLLLPVNLLELFKYRA
ncbi:uncharacterized protein LY79DRAFT_577422 [Colletotrichum navitas]|uniref:Uncharacterized protein n=1 Tax=Colletotrichum navitas TaxID=681940 RepID=A0AAD8Q732_9PEZI|nr:uncharacterized protein LY79DRAFT_577422 [Colletotrichum navitas]KAK1596397.1 hypothetical protein LY79DRAFT_577422 [Colletotrichum navitas]